MADADLPVFSFRANWREPMIERLSFLTDVLAASEGAEQRRSLRPTPRRSFDGDFLLTGPERTFWDLFVNSLGGGEVAVPLYWEVVSLTAPLVALESVRIDFDTSYREWAYHEGLLGLLVGKSALDYELVEIAAVDASGVTLAGSVARAWPRGTKFLPLRRAVIEQIGDLNHQTAATATVSAQFRIVGPNPWTPAVDDSPVYGSLPVFLSEPNWVEDLAVDADREIALLDTDVGLTYQVDTLGRVLLGQAHRWFLTGRQKLAGFRDLIYRHRGRAGAFWLPTFKADFRLVNSPAAGASQIEVENVGFLYTGGPTSGREYIAIKHAGGTILRKITSVEAGSTAATEKLNLDAALGLALSPGLVRRISFADVARFDGDDFDITHYGGVDAHHDATAMFRTFKNTRSSPAPIYDPIPDSFMSDSACGAAEDYSFEFSDNLPYMTDGDTFNSGSVERGNVTLEIGHVNGLGTSLRIAVSSVPRTNYPDLNLGTSGFYEHPSGALRYFFDRDAKILHVQMYEGYSVQPGSHRLFTQGRADVWNGEPWTCVQRINGAIVPFESQSGPNPTGGSGFNGNPDFDDILMFFNG